jgi:EamA domain-containing membrane protein RarD
VRTNRIPLILTGCAAVVAWGMVFLLMNSVSPSPYTQVLLLVLLFLALSLTALPLAYGVARKWAASLGRRGNLQRAARQGAVIGALGTVLVGMRFLGVLNAWVALALLMAAAVVETLLELRFR